MHLYFCFTKRVQHFSLSLSLTSKAENKTRDLVPSLFIIPLHIKLLGSI